MRQHRPIDLPVGRTRLDFLVIQLHAHAPKSLNQVDIALVLAPQHHFHLFRHSPVVLRLNEQSQYVQFRFPIVRGEFHTGNGFNAAADRGTQKLRKTRHRIVVAQRQRPQVLRPRQLDQIGRRNRTVRAIGMDMQITNSDHGLPFPVFVPRTFPPAH